MKNPVAFVRVQEKVKTTSTVDIFICFQGLNRVNVSVSKDMFLRTGKIKKVIPLILLNSFHLLYHQIALIYLYYLIK
jgi:hypothetical protein